MDTIRERCDVDASRKVWVSLVRRVSDYARRVGSVSRDGIAGYSGYRIPAGRLRDSVLLVLADPAVPVVWNRLTRRDVVEPHRRRPVAPGAAAEGVVCPEAGLPFAG